MHRAVLNGGPNQTEGLSAEGPPPLVQTLGSCEGPACHDDRCPLHGVGKIPFLWVQAVQLLGDCKVPVEGGEVHGGPSGGRPLFSSSCPKPEVRWVPRGVCPPYQGVNTDWIQVRMRPR